jgi:hypothetical protein
MRGSASTLTRCTTPPSSTPAMMVNTSRIMGSLPS